MTTVIYEHRYAGWHRHTKNAGDISVLVRWSRADADLGDIPSQTVVADIDIVTAGGEIEAGVKTQGDVAAAGGVVLERTETDCRVAVANCVLIKRIITDCRIVRAGGVAKKR